MRKILFLLVGLILSASLVGCSKAPPYACPASIPGGSLTNGRPIPVLAVSDDEGRRASARQIRERDNVVCEADANGNGIGDEFEVEAEESRLNDTDAS